MTARLYRTKPQPVQAIQWDGSRDSAYAILEMVGRGSLTISVGSNGHPLALHVTAGKVAPDDWVIRPQGGHVQVMSPQYFADTYEAADAG